MRVGALLAHCSRMRTIWMLCALSLFGCGKKDNDDLKNKARALRDQARACKDKACATTTRDDFIALTKDLSKLSDSDSKFFADVANDIALVEHRFDRAEKMEKTEKTPQRHKAAGFSVILPTGWETRDMKRPEILLAAAKGNITAGATFIVRGGDTDTKFGTQPECDALGAEQAATFKGKLHTAKLFDLGGGKACVLRLARDTRDSLIAFIPDVPGKMFYAMCDGPVGNTTMMEDCPVLLTSWQAEH
jgi:hypothetical protein